MDAASKLDLEMPERRRFAQRYCSNDHEQCPAEIDAGTDPYTSKWFDYAIWVVGGLTAAMVYYDFTDGVLS